MIYVIYISIKLEKIINKSFKEKKLVHAYHGILFRNELLKHATLWPNLQIIKLSEKNQFKLENRLVVARH